MSDQRTTNRRVVLGMPGYGKQTAAAGRGFWRASRDMDSVYGCYQSGSLLAANFNQLWCLALNLHHRGERVDYFAMLHDDIGPEDFWLDKLIDELDSNRLDVLGVAVPIKDTRGLTSIALDRDGDDWHPLGRLSMHDLFELPETFTGDDLGGKRLLLNTGCWVAKWDQEWARCVHFEINDRIVFNKATNRYQSQTEPEDWHFSRQLHEIGRGPTAHVKPLRIGCTRKIAVTHQGEMDFTNQRPWGSEPFDREICDKSPVPGAFPRDIAGWLHPEEAKQLEALASGKRVLEIGSYCGLSTVVMARVASHVTAVDYFDGRCTPIPGDTRSQFEASLARHGVADRVTAQSPDEPLIGEYDVVYIDAGHDYEDVQKDAYLAAAVLADNGRLVFHDYGHASHTGIKRVVDQLCEQGGRLESVTHTLAVVSPPEHFTLEV